jgi:penicillin-binding protein 2
MIFVSSTLGNMNPRLRVLSGIIGVALVVLMAGMARVQVLRGGLWSDYEQKQSLRRVWLPSVRGDIVDRNGEVLASNRPSYDVVMYLDQVRISKKGNIMSVVRERERKLSDTMRMPIHLNENYVRAHYAQNRPLPLTIWRDLSPEQVAYFSERAAHLTGAHLMVNPVRQFPHGPVLAHVLGFVTMSKDAPTDNSVDDDVFDYFQGEAVGKQGIELAYNQYLRGSVGARMIRVNPAGTTVEEVAVTPSTRGNRVVLTIDLRLQQVAERTLMSAPAVGGRKPRGAAVVIDPRNGEVLAMASVPAFDPNIFIPGTPAALVQAVLDDKANAPMENRATRGLYAPGSTFKPVSLLAALESGVASTERNEPVTCTGSMKIGAWPRPFRCWNHDGHGTVEMIHAMRQSCDIWFYERGMATGVEKIAAVSREFGLGGRMGIDLAGEKSGMVPTPSWKKKEKDEAWWDGDTAQLAIGQSFLQTTPLQMACVAATLANGGTRWQPHLVREIRSADGALLHQAQPRMLGQVRAARSHMEVARRSMLAAVMDANGTGHRAMVRDIVVAGKTGTAEKDIYENLQWRRINHVWFIGFAPYDNPTVAVAVMLEEGDSGGHTAAPLAGQILAACLGKEVERVSGGGGD